MIKKLRFAYINKILVLQYCIQYCCNSTGATVLLQQYCMYSTVYTVRSKSMTNIHFFKRNKIFLARIDQQVKSYHSRSSKHYSNIKSISIINIHFFQYNNMIFSKDRSASRDLSF